MTLTPDLNLPAPVLIVEDEALIRQRLLNVLRGLGYAPDALVFAASVVEARACVAAAPVALALVDLRLPDGSGIDLIREWRATDPALPMLVISAWGTQDAILAALRAGATGYVLKERDDMEVTLSIRSVLRGGTPIDPFMARRIIAELQPAAGQPEAPVLAAEDDAAMLSARENQILRLVADGLSNREITESLFLWRHTVECHVKHIYRKLEVSEARTRGLPS